MPVVAKLTKHLRAMPINSPTSTPTSGLSAAAVVIAGIVAATHVGKVSPAIPVLSTELGLDLAQAGWLLSLSQMAGMSAAVLVGMWADGFGLKRSMLLGLVSLGLLSGWGALAESASQLLVIRAIEGAAILMVIVPGPALIRRLVSSQHIGIALGFWGTFMPAGVATALLLGPSLMGHWGWAAWWTCLGVCALVMAGVLAYLVPTARSAKSEPAHVFSRADAWRRLRLVLQTPRSWRIALAFGCYSGQWLVVIGFLPTVLQHAGIGATALGTIVAAASGVNIIGNIAGGRLIQRGVPASRVLAIGFATMGAGAVVLFAGDNYSSVALQLTAAVVFSGVGGMIPGSLFSLAVKAAPSEDTISTALGWTTQMSMLAQFITPPLAAALASAHGGWGLTWFLTLSLCALGLWLTRKA
jgi:MFS family permease